jgi:DNA invertase Pin-like site-specific DNA recombinase
MTNEMGIDIRFGSESAAFTLPNEREACNVCMNPAKKEAVWIYCRSATVEDNALQIQREAARSYAAARNLTVMGETSDIGSGLRYDHPGLVKMLSVVKNGLISAVVVRDMSRIGRNAIKTLEIIENEMGAYGVKLLCYSDGRS